MGKQNIYDHDSVYSFLRPYVDWVCRNSYRKYEVTGRENLPEDGAVILAPNHCNTLMDALVILAAFKDETVFGARADLFNKPAIAKIMYFLRILPMVRQRDGLRNVLKNYETTEVISETLGHDVRFCMFPEGRHRPARSIMPLAKGIFRAALAANAKFGEEKPVYIVPVGLEYGDYFNYRSTCLMTIGKPMNVSEFVRETDITHEGQLIESLREKLRSRMSELITFLPDDESLDAKWVLLKMLAVKQKQSNDLSEKMASNRRIAEVIEKKFADKGKAADALLDKVRKFNGKRLKKKISIYSFGKKNTRRDFFLSLAADLIIAPSFLFFCLAALPQILLSVFLTDRIKDRAFHNTARYGVHLALGPLMFILWSILAGCFLPWMVAVPVVLLTIPAYWWAFDCFRILKMTASTYNLMSNRDLMDEHDSIINEFERL
ncbi:MAG: 1-acyl-sn-glycerol-3-phosphate acyltransferase [Candidatus Cryptobacteroides sp.]